MTAPTIAPPFRGRVTADIPPAGFVALAPSPEGGPPRFGGFYTSHETARTALGYLGPGFDVFEVCPVPAAGPPRYSWTQPQCAGCWDRAHPDRIPVQVRDAGPEVCVTCGGPAAAGLYIRINPATAPHPTLRKD